MDSDAVLVAAGAIGALTFARRDPEGA